MAEPSTMVACRLPAWLIDDAKRHARLYHSDLSKLLREALTYRLAFKTWPPAPRDARPGALPPHVHDLLRDLATHVDQVRRDLAQAPDPPAEPAGPSGAQEDAARAALAPAPPGQYFGSPCKARGHVSHGYTPRGEAQNLRTRSGTCVACEAAKKAAVAR